MTSIFANRTSNGSSWRRLWPGLFTVKFCLRCVRRRVDCARRRYSGDRRRATASSSQPFLLPSSDSFALGLPRRWGRRSSTRRRRQALSRNLHRVGERAILHAAGAGFLASFRWCCSRAAAASEAGRSHRGDSRRWCCSRASAALEAGPSHRGDKGRWCCLRLWKRVRAIATGF